MSSDYDISDDDGDYYDDEDMFDGTQEDVDSEDEMDMDAFGDDFKVNTAAKKKSYEIDYDSLSQAAVEKQMRQDIEHCCGILGIEESAAALLLRYQSWNKERLIEKFMDNPSAMLVAAGIASPSPDSPTSPRGHSVSAQSTSSQAGSTSKSIRSSPPMSSKSLKSPTEPFVCPICFEDSAELQSLGLDCGHMFCSGCWTGYTTSKIKDEGEYCIRCMAESCALVAPDHFIRSSLLPEGSSKPPEENVQVWTRFQELLVRNFVASMPNLKFCPYPGCTNTVSCSSAASKSSLTTIVPIVSCGARGIPGSEEDKKASNLSIQAKEHKFCFGCPIETDHRPVVCAVARMWLKKCEDDSETANWIKSNTKECSQCHSTIEKNGGCNHMTCKKCKHEFCWVCMGPWSEHGTAWYSCNRYDEKNGVEARDAQSRSRASLERYLHYYNRWANHEQSAKLSLDLYAKTEKKMEDMQITSELTWIEVQFMKKAVEEVEKCRMTLKWTYAMAYYLAKGNEKDLFEDNQRDLEKAVEDLSELLESPIEAEDIPQLRQKVTDKTVYVAKRNDIVLEDTANGFLEGRWRWNVQVDGFEPPEQTAL
ncbi:ring finger protein [Moniliophthora roreri MCA 2997]|uniref:RBR-type E3 ubiquitin transferase n=1 Tax=Moniliophthora roreri (strain MCA 2997) TaxID=1381753 RepID=V2XHD2_MONRO|nr:ring finger protein [Moniliophthora roreri MCA 2997]